MSQKYVTGRPCQLTAENLPRDLEPPDGISVFPEAKRVRILDLRSLMCNCITH